MSVNTFTIEQNLRNTWRRQRLLVHARGLCLALICIAGIIIIDLALDWALVLPGWGRIALLAANAAVLGWIMVRRWALRLRRFNVVRTALQVERQYPQLRSLLVSYVQLGETAAAGASPWLIGAMRRQAVELTGRLDFRQIARLVQLRRTAAICAGALAVVMAGGVILPGFYSVLFQRLASPSSSAGYPTRTRITSTPGDLVVRGGDPIVLTARAAGLVPAQATLEITNGRGSRERLVVAGSRDEFTHRVPVASRSFAYRFRIGDAATAPATVTVVPPPAIADQKVSLRYPACTGMKPTTVEVLTLDVPEGTVLTWRIDVDRPLAGAELMVQDAPPIKMDVSAAGTGASASIEVRKSFAYWFRWTCREHGYAYETEARYAIRAVPDSPPVVELTGAGTADKATAGKRLALAVHASDDYGLARVSIVYAVNFGAEQRVPIRDLTGRDARFGLTWTIKDSIPKLVPGDAISYCVEVEDNREPAPSRGRSAVYRIQILSVEEYLRYIRETERPLFDRIRDSRDSENASHQAVESLEEGFK